MTSVSNSTAFVCQESFFANGTTSCLRYSKLKHCIKDGTDNHLNFQCVDHDTISSGGSGPNPLPTNINMTIFLCSMASCPTEAPASGKKGQGNSDGTASNGSTNNAAESKVDGRKLTLSGLLVLMLMVSQLVLL
ncbi:hypothetical protein EDD11_005379 [Mortierella claussenii]|nr:hypothetical protein EDD11_005379 [Mortierella claussenii]